MDKEAPYFGIDFGTTNSSMSCYDPKSGKAEIIKNFDGEEKTPSMVFFDEDGEVLVGKDVEEKLKEYENSPDPDERAEVNRRVVRSIKRNLLEPASIPIPGRKPVTPAEVVAEILGKLKRDAEEGYFYEEVDRVVITHPARFSPQQQEVLFEGAAKAGFGQIEPYEEPSAAALTVTREQPGKIGHGLLVYDFGAGTFDLSILIRDGEGSFYLPMKPLGVVCGGDDLDMALYEYCDEIAKETMGRPISLSGDVDLPFLQTCRDRKHNLSKSQKAKFTNFISSENGPVRFVRDVERTKFEELIRERIAGTVEKTAEFWAKAGGEGYTLDTLVLIGGSSRVPMVMDLLKAEESIPVEPRDYAGKDIAVSLGAAYHAYDFWKPGKVIPDIEPPEIIEYRKSLTTCWTDRVLTHTEVEHLEKLKGKKLKLGSDDAARIEREVMGQAMPEILEDQEKVARGQYGKVLKLGWKENKLDKLKQTPSSTLRMLLDNHEFFCEGDFPDCPMSAAKRKELASGLPWTMFVMAVHIAADDTLGASATARRLRDLAQEMGLSDAQAANIESEVLGSTVEKFFEGREKEELQNLRDEYRKEVEKAGKGGKAISKLSVDLIRRVAERLDLPSRESDAIETDVLGGTVEAVVAEQEEVRKLADKHKVKLSEIKGTGKKGRITKRDVEARVEVRQRKKRQEKEREERGRREKEERQRDDNHDEAQKLLDQADGQQNEGELDLALQTVQAACEVAPNYAPAFLKKAEFLRAKNEYTLAVAAATSCLRIEPDNFMALWHRSICKFLLKDYAGAKKDEDRMVELSPAFFTYEARAWTNFQLGDNRAAVDDLRAALRDPNADKDQLGAAHARLGFLLHKKLNSPKDALPAFQSALETIPAEPGEEYAQAFSFTMGGFGIEYESSPVQTVHKLLWEACKAVHGSASTQAVDDFINHVGDNASINREVWKGDPIFGLRQASSHARQGNGEEAIAWLQTLFAMHPDFSASQVKNDAWIQASGDKALREFLTPSFTYSNSIGQFFNSLTVTNTSAFRVTIVQATANVTRNDGQRVAPIEREVQALGTGEAFTWNEVFPDAGLFGGNIKEVAVNVRCAE